MEHVDNLALNIFTHQMIENTQRAWYGGTPGNVQKDGDANVLLISSLSQQLERRKTAVICIYPVSRWHLVSFHWARISKQILRINFIEGKDKQTKNACYH